MWLLGRRGVVESPYFTIVLTFLNILSTIARRAFFFADSDADFGKSNQVILRFANVLLTALTEIPLVDVAQTITSHRSFKNSFRLLSV